MKRYSALEFPEYAKWEPNEGAMAEFRSTITMSASRHEMIQALSKETHLALYRSLLRARLHDIQLKRWVRQGVITKAWLGTGEEAVTIGACKAMRPGDVVGPMIRNAAALMEQGMSLETCFAGYLGTTETITRGRDLHIGDPAKGVIPPISHIGDLVPVMAGCALAFKQENSPKIALTWTGDGSTATGAFHEGMKMAASLSVPLICIVQNNQVALGTQRQTHFPGSFDQLGAAYGIHQIKMSGNHILDCYAATREAVAHIETKGGPVLIVTETFRMGGHATHDEKEARELFDDETYRYWGARDPIGCYETFLMEDLSITQKELESAEKEMIELVDQAARTAVSKVETHQPNVDDVGLGVYAEDTIIHD